jgi:hypothetical protein
MGVYENLKYRKITPFHFRTLYTIQGIISFPNYEIESPDITGYKTSLSICIVMFGEGDLLYVIFFFLLFLQHSFIVFVFVCLKVVVLEDLYSYIIMMRMF